MNSAPAMRAWPSCSHCHGRASSSTRPSSALWIRRAAAGPAPTPSSAWRRPWAWAPPPKAWKPATGTNGCAPAAVRSSRATCWPGRCPSRRSSPTSHRPAPLPPRYNGAMDVSHLIDGLNADQRQAVTAEPGHYLVLAGAGSGKTRVLTHRIAWLTEVHGVPAHGIFAVTFTNKAAGEMRQRTSALLESSPNGGSTRGMWIGTFHGLAHRLLRLHWQDAKLPESFQILDSDDQQRLIKRVVQQLELDEARFPPRQIAWWINAQKDEGRRPQHIQAGDDQWADVMRRSYALYQERCDRAGLVDFAELLLRTHELLRDTPALLAHYRQRFGQILVDEFQDTNAIQYAFIRVLAGESTDGSGGKVFVVGDDDQAIYGWRGAKVENVQKFLKD